MVAEKDGERTAVTVHHSLLDCCSWAKEGRGEGLPAPSTSLLHPLGQHIFVLDCARGGLALWPAVGTQVTISLLFQQWDRWEHTTCQTWLTRLHQASREALQSPVNEEPSALTQGVSRRGLEWSLQHSGIFLNDLTINTNLPLIKLALGTNSRQEVNISVGRTALLSNNPHRKVPLKSKKCRHRNTNHS